MAKIANVALMIWLSTSGAYAADRYHVTDGEKAACTADAMRFCLGTYPDEVKLLSCMRQNRGALSDSCRVAFDAGVKRRHL